MYHRRGEANELGFIGEDGLDRSTCLSFKTREHKNKRQGVYFKTGEHKNKRVGCRRLGYMRT